MDEKKFFKVEFGRLVEVDKEKCQMLNFFFIAPSLEQLKAVTQVVAGACARNTNFNKLQWDVRYNFKVGDPIEFSGVPVCVGSLSEDPGNQYLEIKIKDGVYFYSLIRDNVCLFVEVLS